MEKTWEKEQTMACRDDRRGIAPEIPLLKGQHPFHLKIDQRNCLPKYTEIESHQCGTPSESPKHCFSSNIHGKMSSFYLLSKRKSFYLVTAGWRHGTTQLSCEVRVAHQFRVGHCFIAMFPFLVLPIHISFKVFTKNAISIWTIFWKMPHFTPAEIFCQEWRCRRGGGGCFIMSLV